ncbi:acyl dehydratase, partial [Campylobacter hyointestinalis subsp. hyointestinalis]
VTAQIEVINIYIDKKKVLFRTTCTVKNRIVIDGEAEIFIP